MGFKDKLNSLADLLHFNSESYEAQDAQMYDEQYDYEEPYDDYGYDDQYEYDDPGEPSTFESYGAAGGYTSAGARPAQRNKSKGSSSMRSMLEKVRGTRPEPAQGSPSRRPDNVIPMSYADRYADPPQQPRIPQRYPEEEYEQAYAPDVDAPPARPPRNVTRTSTMIVTVRRLEDSEEIIYHMLEGGSVIINMEEIDEALKKRMIDIISGAAFALEATIKRISYRNYYVAGSGEEIITNASLREQEPPIDDGGGYYSRDRRYER